MARWGLSVAFTFYFLAPAYVNAEESVDTARNYYQQAVERFGAGDYEAALDLFEQSYTVRPVPTPLYNIGMCHRALLHYSESVDAFDRYLEAGGERIPAERRSEVIRLIDEMTTQLGAVHIEVSPPNAIVSVDGAIVDPARFIGLRLAPGSYLFVAEASGYRSALQRVQVTIGTTTNVTLELVAETAEPASPLSNDARSDDVSSRPPSISGTAVPEDLALVQRTSESYIDTEMQDATHREGEHLTSRHRWWIWVTLAGGALVAVALGLGFGLGLQDDGPPTGDWHMRLP
jgi:hypothetical protein